MPALWIKNARVIDPAAKRDAVGDLFRACERRLHRVLLIKQHADQQREGIGFQQRVGRRILD